MRCLASCLLVSLWFWLNPQKFDVLNGAYDDMNSDWYGAAGVYIGTLVLSNTIVPLLLMVLDWFLRGVKRTLAVYDLVRFV